MGETFTLHANNGHHERGVRRSGALHAATFQPTMAAAEKTMRPFAARGRGHGLRANAVHTAVAPLRARARAGSLARTSPSKRGVARNERLLPRRRRDTSGEPEEEKEPLRTKRHSRRRREGHTQHRPLRGSAAPVRSREGPPHAHARSENTLPAADKRGPRFRDDRAERGAPPQRHQQPAALWKQWW